MNKRTLISAALSGICMIASAQTVDPNHASSGGYGHVIDQSSKATVWWAEGAYKIMKDAPVPDNTEKSVNLSCAGNEWESFAIVIDPKEDIKGIDFKLKPFKKLRGRGRLSGLRSEIRKVEYVNVSVPTDSYGKAGLWPDPMPVFNKEDLTVENGLQPYWFSVKLPKDTPAGDYVSTLVIKPLRIRIPVRLHVWNFSLPDSPSLKSLFGFSIDRFVQYDHLNTEKQKIEAFDKHMASFRDFKIAPYNPFEMTPIRTNVKGIDWKGGCFDSSEKYEGSYSYRVEDESMTSSNEAQTTSTYPTGNAKGLKISFWAQAAESGQDITVGIECYDADGNILPYGARFQKFQAGSKWSQYAFETGELTEGAESFSFHISPCARMLNGVSTGKVWIDDISVTDEDNNELLPCGDFEPNLEEIDIEVDLSGLSGPARKYFGEYGFTNFCLSVKGLGGGTNNSRRKGNFDGFDEGTPEYEKLFEKYLMSLDKGLCELDIADKACIYWFDEPGDDDYDFVHDTNARIKKYAPHLKPFITEFKRGHDISDVTDYSCTIWHLLNHEKVQKMNAKGMESWSYLCTGPKSPWITEFIDHDAINLRMWCIGSYKHDLKGLLIWSTVYWNSPDASLKGRLHNPWEDGQSWCAGYGTEYRQLLPWGNGDGRFFYPLNREPNDGNTDAHTGDPIPSIRLQFLRDGIEDFEYYKIYEQLSGSKLAIPESIYTDEKTYDKNPADVLSFRKEVAEAIEKMK